MFLKCSLIKLNEAQDRCGFMGPFNTSRMVDYFTLVTRCWFQAVPNPMDQHKMKLEMCL